LPDRNHQEHYGMHQGNDGAFAVSENGKSAHACPHYNGSSGPEAVTQITRISGYIGQQVRVARAPSPAAFDLPLSHGDAFDSRLVVGDNGGNP
jgi:hypothetical protein